MKTRAAEKRQRREDEREALRAMHAAVWARNLRLTCDRFAPAGRCDGCGCTFRHVSEGEMDHWISKAQGGPNEADNSWRLCGPYRNDCHRRKTDNLPPPGGGTWDAVRQAYCTQAGIPYVARRKVR